MREAYIEGRVLVAVSAATNLIMGVIVWSITSEGRIFFGPFAVDQEYKGKGLGKQLIEQVDRIAEDKLINEMEISVVNHRTDLFPYYEKMGFCRIGSKEFEVKQGLTRPATLIILRRRIPSSAKSNEDQLI